MFTSRYSSTVSQCGLTLIELIVAMTLSGFLLTAILQIYLMAHKSLETQWKVSDRESNVRIAMELLTKNIRMAGHVGCGVLSDGFPVVGYSTYVLNMENKITEEGMPDRKEKSDAITVRYMSDRTVKLMREMTSEWELFVGGDADFKEGDILMISNCEGAEIFQVDRIETAGDMQHILPKEKLSRKFNQYSEVGKLVVNTFFIKKTGRKHQNKENIYALYSADMSRDKLELVEDVQDMKVEYLRDKENILRGVQAELEFYAANGAHERHAIFVALR